MPFRNRRHDKIESVRARAIGHSHMQTATGWTQVNANSNPVSVQTQFLETHFLYFSCTCNDLNHSVNVYNAPL